MIAKKSKVENKTNFGTCGKCKKEKVLEHELKKNGQVCDECYLEITQIEIPTDEYSLQPDELTKEQFAEKAGVSMRNIEIWKKAGKLPAQKLRRRVNDVVRSQLIFKSKDVENFLKDENKPVNLPTVEKEMETQSLQLTKSAENLFLETSQIFANDNLGINERMIKAQLDKAEADAKKAIYQGNPTFALDAAAELFNLSIVDLKANAKTFKGKNQKLMITKRNLDDYLNNL